MLHNKILVVDDEPDLQMLVMQRFRHQIREGRYQFEFAENGLVALNRIEATPDFSLVLTDINMPEMDGLTLLENLKEKNRDDMKTVVVSAYGDMDNIRVAMNRGAYDFITKPIDFVDLETTIVKTMNEVGRIRQALDAQSRLSNLQFELDTASRIQQRILKRTFPAFPDRNEFDLYASMTAARDVGGDLYDFFFIDPDRLVFLVGDVSGKGVPASIYMAVCRTMIRAVASQVVDPGECLRKVNEMLIPESDLTTFVTVFYGVYNTRTGEVRYCNGGHNLPYIRRKDGSIEMLEDTDGLLLGKIPRIEYDVKKIKLEPGDHLLVYTDGVTEAMNLEGEFYEEPRLESTMATANASTAENLVKTVLRDVLQFANGADPSDDITVLDLMRVK
jgi:sigma-B regulation protein RsbU (phosphoserine phosphatase)